MSKATGKALIGMLHLPALPGAPRSTMSLHAIESRILEEAGILAQAGFDACILENYGDVPFFKDSAGFPLVAAMTRLATCVRREVPDLRLGINVLRNDASAAMAIAAATGAQFIRVNVHVGATATDQGVVEGRAAQTLRLRRELGAEVEIWADVHVKHGHSLAHESIAREAEDAVQRGLADALIVSGTGTGESTDLDDLHAVCAQRLGVPVYVGSGVTEANVATYLLESQGVIVGTSLKKDGQTRNLLDPERARRFVDLARRASSA